MLLNLDRTEIREIGPSPEDIASCIHRQLGPIPSPYPFEDIARALDIVEIRREPLDNLEAALLTDRARDRGAILLNARAGRRRQNFSLVHELGHFLIETHEPSVEGFTCDRADLSRRSLSASLCADQRQEVEANRFAISLIAPPDRLLPYVSAEVGFESVLDLGDAFDLSKESAARRYAEFHKDQIAIFLCHYWRVRYVVTSPGFPRLACWSGDRLVETPSRAMKWCDVDPRKWLKQPSNRCVRVQKLAQQDDYQMVMVWVQ